MAVSKIALGAALQFAIDKLGGPVVEEDKTVSVASTVTQLMQGDGDRVGLVMVNVSLLDMFIAPDPGVSSSLGILLPASGGFIALDVTTDFTMQTRVWYGITSGGGPGNIYVLSLKRFSLAQGSA